MNQTDKIKYFQRKGYSYNKTSKTLGIKEEYVKTFYRRNPIDNTCLCCAKELPASTAHRKRMFCSDKCRYTWWYRNRDLKPIPNAVETVCAMCGTTFVSRASAKRKYCSLACHYKARKEAHKNG